MRGREMFSEAEYLDRAKELRARAKLISDARALAYLIAAAESCERMGRWGEFRLLQP
jgi:hypothetical protein